MLCYIRHLNNQLKHKTMSKRFFLMLTISILALNNYAQELNVEVPDSIYGKALRVTNTTDSVFDCPEMDMAYYYICNNAHLTINDFAQYSTFFVAENGNLTLNALPWDTRIYLQSNSTLEVIDQAYGYSLQIFYETGANITTGDGDWTSTTQYDLINYSFVGFEGALPCEAVNKVSEKLIEELLVFPNPASVSCNITATQNISAVSLYDYTGKMIGSFDVDNTTFELPLQNVSQGLYVVKIDYCNQTAECKRLIVE